ncbi:hypothetical protein BC834DRAFT_970673 [Gloeopeniophorella convolvens]|nr:hypothetical protein BC834DRAFT_970673 [Gloeopeniophorella convolvens]
MLPLALKIIWFVFAFLGVIATWLVLVPFAASIGTYWAPILYCVTVTLMEGVFCIGMIWKMNPAEMPHAFCVAQAVLIGFCAHVLTGICSCFTWATYLTVFRPYQSIQASGSALMWRKTYYLFVVAFPVLASTAHLVAVLKTGSVKPLDDLHCDSVSPLWPRLLSYAGAPMALLVPCFALSTITAIRVIKMHAGTRGWLGEDTRVQSVRAPKRNSRMARLSRLSTGRPATDKPTRLSSQMPDDKNDSKFDVQLHRSGTRVSSRPQSPKTVDTVVASSSHTHVYLDSSALPPLLIPAAHHHHYHAPPSPTMSNKSTIFADTDRAQTPSPITFAPVPSPQRRAVPLDGDAGHPLRYVTSVPDPGALYPIDAPDAVAVAVSPPEPAPQSPSRARISLDAGDTGRGFHLPTRQSASTLRPSLELSPEYVQARLEQDRAVVAAFAQQQHQHSYPPATPFAADALSSLPTVAYAERALDGLPEVEEAERGKGVDEDDADSILKDERDFMDYEGVLEDAGAPPLKPVRQFYRSAPRPSVGRPPGLGPAIWRLIVFQMAFFFILLLAALSTLVDLARDQPPTPFGTQHVALLLAAWGPVIVFGYFPGARNPLFHWFAGSSSS